MFKRLIKITAKEMNKDLLMNDIFANQCLKLAPTNNCLQTLSR